MMIITQGFLINFPALSSHSKDTTLKLFFLVVDVSKDHFEMKENKDRLRLFRFKKT